MLIEKDINIFLYGIEEQVSFFWQWMRECQYYCYRDESDPMTVEIYILCDTDQTEVAIKIKIHLVDKIEECDMYILLWSDFDEIEDLKEHEILISYYPDTPDIKYVGPIEEITSNVDEGKLINDYEVSHTKSTFIHFSEDVWKCIFPIIVNDISINFDEIEDYITYSYWDESIPCRLNDFFNRLEEL